MPLAMTSAFSTGRSLTAVVDEAGPFELPAITLIVVVYSFGQSSVPTIMSATKPKKIRSAAARRRINVRRSECNSLLRSTLTLDNGTSVAPARATGVAFGKKGMQTPMGSTVGPKYKAGRYFRRLSSCAVLLEERKWYRPFARRGRR